MKGILQPFSTLKNLSKFQVLGIIISTVLFFVLLLITTYNENYLLLAAPVIGFVLLLFVLNFNAVLLLIAFLTPFSLEVSLIGDSKLSILTEPLLIFFSFLFIVRLFLGAKFKKDLIKHPVSILVLLSLVWMIVTSLTAELPLVAIKHTFARMWFVIPFFFAALQVLHNPKTFKTFYFCYCFSLLIIILIASYNLYASGFAKARFHNAMCPFYNDHTEYGAILALFIPVCWMYLIQKSRNIYQKALVLIAFSIIMLGFILSFSRAAWISLFAAVGMYLVIKTGIKMKWVLLGTLLMASVFFSYQFDVIYHVGKNKQDSSDNLLSHFKSISNISTDDSNLERLNRWASAFRMIEERPVFGWGPGTYQHLYAPYQKSYQLSRVSTNAGDFGDVHSEYIGPFVESGFFGFVITSMIILLTFGTGVKVYRRAQDKSIALLALYLTLALFTYYVHGVFNNFLIEVKLSVPFWAFTATIVALDVYYPKKSKKQPELDLSGDT